MSRDKDDMSVEERLEIFNMYTIHDGMWRIGEVVPTKLYGKDSVREIYGVKIYQPFQLFFFETLGDAKEYVLGKLSREIELGRLMLNEKGMDESSVTWGGHSNPL